jgi:hypothetical protein
MDLITMYSNDLVNFALYFDSSWAMEILENSNIMLIEDKWTSSSHTILTKSKT